MKPLHYATAHISKNFRHFLLGTNLPASVREICFAEIEHANYIYDEQLIKLHQCKQWDDMLKFDMKGLTNTDPFCIESLHTKEELSSLVKTQNVLTNPLVVRYNSRYQSTNLLDFLHGRCLRFQNFVFSVLKYDKSAIVPLCLECSTFPDSVYHKIFECAYYSNEVIALRNQLSCLRQLEVNFHLQLVFGNDYGDDMDIRSIFYDLVNLICKESTFKDDFSVRIED